MTILKFTPKEALELTSSNPVLEAALRLQAELVNSNVCGKGRITIEIARRRNRKKKEL